MKKLRVVVCVLISLMLCLSFAPDLTARADSESVYIGGFPIGISLDVGGLLVENVTGVETEYGLAYVEGLRRGDVIRKIDGVAIATLDDMQNAVDSDLCEIEILRGGSVMNVSVKPIAEAYTGKFRLGVKVKDKLYGIGTVTFVRRNGNYTALGHEIYDSETDARFPFCGGNIYACKILGIKRGSRNEAGAILASLNPDKPYGIVTCCNKFGIAGKYDKSADGETVQIAARSEVKPGAAKIRTTVDKTPEYFDVEIIKASKQSGKREKGLVIRVTDKRLLNISGGVVRGMSGSPIIQNGKLVGAVTHVFLNDFTKGYGVYADCLN